MGEIVMAMTDDGAVTRDVAHCRSCGAAILWVTTQRGKPMPVDAEPTWTGTIALELRDGELVARVTYEPIDQIKLIETTPPKYVSHFATCPDREEWRR